MTEDLDDFDLLIAQSSDLTVEDIFTTTNTPTSTTPTLTETEKKKRGRKRKVPNPTEVEPQFKKPPLPVVTPFQRPLQMTTSQVPQIIMDIGRKDPNTKCIGRIRTKYYTHVNESFKTLLDSQSNIVIITAMGLIVSSLPSYEFSHLTHLLKTKKITIFPIVEQTILILKVYLEEGAFDKTPILNEADVKDPNGFRVDYTRLFLSLEQQDETQNAQIKEEEADTEEEEEDNFDLEEELGKSEEPSESAQGETGKYKELYESVTEDIVDSNDVKNLKNAGRLKLELRGYQKECVQWMVSREESSKIDEKSLHPFYIERKYMDGSKYYYSPHYGCLCEKFVPSPRDACGGILADQMGLGKTIQIIALMLEHQAKKSDCKTNLVLCPLMIIDQWKREIENHTQKPPLKVHVYLGNQRIKDPEKLAGYDVIITTYGTLSSEFKKYASTGELTHCPLYRVPFWRTILDEGHTIKNRKSLQARACCALNTNCRWVLTGTPIQNSLDDLYTLFQFLKVPKLGEWRWWSKHISKQDSKGVQTELPQYLKKYMIRRTKDKTVQGTRILELPKKHIFNVNLDFGPEERFLYDSLYGYSKGVFDSLMAEGTVFKNYANILDLLLSLRQICNHPALFFKTIHNRKSPEMMTFLGTIAQSDKCKSYRKIIDQIQEGTCDIETFLEKHWIPSTKISALIENLGKYKNVKSIIFSQWTSMLDVVEIALDKAKINSSRLDGTMTRKDRDEAIQVFKNDPTVQVCLISLKAGGLGLNLVWAQHVYLLDPWWNPSIEEQAIGRIHRIGQKSNVSVFRFIINETIENKIVKLQKDKSDLAAGLGINEEEMKPGVPQKDVQKDQQKARLDDLQLLFGAEDELDEDDDIHEEDEDEQDDYKPNERTSSQSPLVEENPEDAINSDLDVDDDILEGLSDQE